jgi:flagellar biosynthesis/type III secretory pathway M-ring protein FliF/YscJ
MPGLSDHTSDPVFDGLVRDVSNSPRDRLAKIVELDPDRAVDVLKQWLSEPAGRES